MTCPIIYEFGRKTPHFFLSNFFSQQITVTLVFPDGSRVTETYPSVEHAYQAAKTLSVTERQEFQKPELAAFMAKKMGQFVTLRKDWVSSRVSVMNQLLHAKFQEPFLRENLLATAPKMLIEGNHWHDNFWGVCFCPRDAKGCQGAKGVNNLGKLLMNLRESLQKNPATEVSEAVST